MKNIVKLTLALGIVIGISSCKNDQKPNYQYMPNMYESVAYETYSESNAFKSPYGLKGKEGQLPPDGAIKRGFQPYEYPNTPDALIAVKAANLKSPLDSTQVDMKKAQELFDIYCAICHGTAGDGNIRATDRKAAQAPANAAQQWTTSAEADQRCPGPVQTSGKQADHRVEHCARRRSVRSEPQPGGGAGRTQTHQHHPSARFRPHLCLGRWAANQADSGQPIGQCSQIHPGRGAHRPARKSRSVARPALLHSLGHGHRHCGGGL